MKEFEIKKVTSSDLDQLRSISIRTFRETFGTANTEENMKLYLEESFNPEKLKEEISEPGSEFFFATLNQKVIGYLKLNSGLAQTEMKSENSIEIERIYVLKNFQGKKAGQFLFDTAVNIARQRNCSFLWLGVWEKNFKALGFYRKNGMVEFNRHLFMLGNDKQTDIMMKLSMTTN